MVFNLVINFGNPDKESVAKIYKAYFESLPGQEKLDYVALAERTPDCAGAVVAEIAKRAFKLCSKRGETNDDMVKAAIDSMKHHLALMKEDVEEEQSGEMVIALKGAKMSIKGLNGEAAMLEKHAHN